MTEQEIKEAIEHRDVLIAIKEIMAHPQGRVLFKYLFKHLEVAELPPMGLEGPLLMDKLGSLRVGNSIFKLACEAHPEVAAQLLAQNEKERYEELLAQTRT